MPKTAKNVKASSKKAGQKRTNAQGSSTKTAKKPTKLAKLAKKKTGGGMAQKQKKTRTTPASS